MMRILHVTPSYYSPSSVVGGGEKYVLYMIRAIHEAARGRGFPLASTILTCGAEAGATTLDGDVPCLLMDAKPWDPRALHPGVLRRYLDGYDAVVVHQCLTGFGMFVAAHARLAGKCVVGFDHGGGEHPLVHHAREVGAMYDLFVAQSNFCAASFADLDAPVRKILGPVDTGKYRPPSSAQRDVRLVAAVGRILPHKGFDRIVAALPAGLRLVIVGKSYDPSYADHLRRLVGSTGRDVRIEEGLSDNGVRALLGRASLFVHASTHVDCRGTFYAKPELLGLAPLEALACGTPTLVSHAGSLLELGSLPGCRVFRDDAELAALLQAHGGAPTAFDPSALHRAVDATYGPRQFGDRMLDELVALRSGA